MKSETLRNSSSARTRCRAVRAKRNRCQIHPVILRFFAHKGQIADFYAAAALEIRPTGASRSVCMLRFVFRAHLYDCEVRHVGPLLFIRKTFDVQQIMKFAHSVGSVGNADEDRRSDGDESLNLSQRHLKRLYLLAIFFQSFYGRRLRPLQAPRRKKGDVCGKMRKFRMEFLAEPFDELTNLVLDVSHQGVTLLRSHGQSGIINNFFRADSQGHVRMLLGLLMGLASRARVHPRNEDQLLSESS